ncbi:MAG: FG-GAP repeat domain-containing protein [Armatimonadota bacterium]
MIKRAAWSAAALMGGLLPMVAMAQDSAGVSARYKALRCPPPDLGTTWAILQRDGANRQVEPYLSSLGQGESGTGVVTSPPFVVASDTITFTICGHDGQAGGRGENYIALVDARKGNVLMKTEAPLNDAMQERSWDVRRFRGLEVRIEVHDGSDEGAYAWLGVGRVDAGPAMKVDFRQGMPKDWDRPQRAADIRYEVVPGGIPFKRNALAFSLIPKTGAVEIPCGFPAERLYFLGCTVSGGKALTTYGGIEIHYQTGSPEVFPLMCGFTLDGRHKLLSTSRAMYLHGSADPHQPYLVIAPRAEVIERIRLVADPSRRPIPRITAVTCETAAESDRLMPLPNTAPSAREAAWIKSHSISAGSPELGRIMAGIRKAHGMPSAAAASPIRFRKHKLDGAFRSEGVAVADFDGDGRLDIAAGSVYYAAPGWKMRAMLDEPNEFNRGGYSEAFLCFAEDVNRDGAVDLITVGFPGQQTHWLENPGRAGVPWQKHLAVARTGNESPAHLDVDGDGRKELLFMDGQRCVVAQPRPDASQPWGTRALAGPDDPGAVHGLGAGDVDGDDRTDVLIPSGWWEGPAERGQSPWRFHEVEFYGGAQLCVWDFDGDGDSDVLGSSPHGYGISWCEQTPEGWQTHEIDSSVSQTHALHLADLNDDGLMDFVTGKRFWAHNGHDPGSYEPAVLCWFEQKRPDGRPEWTKHLIDVDSGIGLHFQVIDVNGDRLLDVVTSNKKGVHYFQQVRK